PAVRRLARAMVRPLERFLAIEAASGVVLLLAAAAALIWANSPWHGSYHDLWDLPLRLTLGTWKLETTLHFVVNDILMVIFFFVVGLEIRREIAGGELSDLRRAALPVVAAVGGMLVPAVMYVVLAPGGEAARGWGVPMATDIAFAVGILALLGKRVPAALRVLLLALAIIDDIGAILVIAIFYSSGVELAGFAIAGAGMVAILILQTIGVRRALVYVPAGVAIWAGMLIGGVHPTIAGVILGLMTPARAWYGLRGFLAAGREHLDEIERRADQPDATAHDLVVPLAKLRRAHREALSPCESLLGQLHPWVAFGIMPIFALANAGVDLGGVDLGASPGVLLGIVVGLMVGKPLGVVLACGIAAKARLVSLPRGVDWRGVALVGLVAGIGFTMALFIAALAFAGAPELHATAKLAVLLASAGAAVLTLVAGRFLLPAVPQAGAAATADEAEASTHL
ncbi:MAG: Na+/H+ antiporter NhaA, partial [Myxococcales bacterium]|nr:Na+/H+ antiporter NhaA [Myxococcales bacterium]